MTAAGKITTTEIGRRLAARETVRILVHLDPDRDTVDSAYRKPGAVGATVTKFEAVAGERRRMYKLTTDAGPVAGVFGGSTTHWLAPEEAAEDAKPAVEAHTPAQDSEEQHDPAEPTADDTWTERYSAGWSGGEVTVIRDIRAGISGPFGEYPAADLDEAEKVLRANGYALAGPWAEHTNGHFAPLVLVPQTPAEEETTRTAEEIEAAALATGGSSLGVVQPVPQMLIASNHAPAPARVTGEIARLRAERQALGPDQGDERARLAQTIEDTRNAYNNALGRWICEGGATFEHQASGNGGKTWRTVAVGLDAADVAKFRAANETGEGSAWRILPEGDERARSIAAKEAELAAAKFRQEREDGWRNHGGMRTKNFGRRADGHLRRTAELVRLVERLEHELAALRRPVREVPPLDLERLPYATHIRTDVGWYEVVKVNRKTVKVVVDPGWDDLVPIKKIIELHERPAKPAPAEKASAEAYVSPWASV